MREWGFPHSQYGRLNKVDRLIAATAVLAAASLIVTPLYSPLSYSSEWLIAFLTLLALSLLSEILALQVSEGGTLTSLEFIPQLAAVKLLGPVGAVTLTAFSGVFYEVVVSSKPPRKVAFNIAQVIVSVAAASATYIFLGGNYSLTDLGFPGSLPPFLAAAVVFFGINSTLVCSIVSTTEGRPFIRVWRELKGPIILFDLTISPVAYAVALLYIGWGAWGLIATVIPLLGLRYIYGVNIELQQLNRDLLRVLVKTIEAQDPYTSGHSLRVAEYARTLAEGLNLNQKRIQNIETAALLHDIGKIDRAYRQILRQEGSLTDDQWQLIQAHPERGVEILNSVRSLDAEILEGVRHHHEHYDGSGYPDGISGDDIPLAARIIMVADTIDAMLTPRSYRAPLELPTVKQELKQYSGEQFDPAVVKAAFEANIFELADRNIKDLKVNNNYEDHYSS